MPIERIVIWIGALCTLGLYSVLYRENKVFRFFEHLYIGLGTGYLLYLTWNDTLKPRWWEPMTAEGQWWWAAALPAGLMFYTVYSRKNSWMSRLIFGLFFGLTAGQAFQRYAAVQFPLIRSAVTIPLVNPPEATGPGTYALSPYSAVFNNVLFLAIVVAVMSYFFFSFDLKSRGAATVTRFGRYVLMFAFGAIFGSTIMARLSLLIGRIYFLLHDWLGIAP
ncbi:MAG TPA: hypothetical protein VM490_24860 [Armatimonadaceae bacterium]|nr:hypothetical protein [Armatimonadaceae bacterium]